MKLTQHFRKRSEERKFYPEMLVKVLSGKYVSVPSDRDAAAELIVGVCDGKLWTIVLNIESGAVITARRAHGKEVKWYEEKLK